MTWHYAPQFPKGTQFLMIPSLLTLSFSPEWHGNVVEIMFFGRGYTSVLGRRGCGGIGVYAMT